MSQIKHVHRSDINTAMCAMVRSKFTQEIVGADTTKPIYISSIIKSMFGLLLMPLANKILIIIEK